jgi:uncharacterized protein
MTFDCQACGACCHQFDVLLAPAEEDAFEANPHLRGLTVLHRLSSGMELRFMKRAGDASSSEGRCAALGGELGACTCTIYAQRPHLCAEFEAGSDECIKARKKMGFAAPPEPLLNTNVH